MTTASNDFGPRGFALKPLHLIGVAIIVMAIAMGYSGLRTAFRPYTTSVSEAIRSGRSVQLAGFLNPADPAATTPTATSHLACKIAAARW